MTPRSPRPTWPKRPCSPGRTRTRWRRRSCSSAEGTGPRALLLRVRGTALMKLGHREAAAAAIEDALAKAREYDDRHEVALVLDALIALDGASLEAALERDEIASAIGISAFYAPPG